jgi:dipeptide transport system ATP-binding protein
MINLLQIENLNVCFDSPRGRVRAVSDACLTIKPGETRGIIGESGSGKSVLAKALSGLINERADVSFDYFGLDDKSITELPPSERFYQLNKSISIIFQNPSESLNPTLTIGRQLRETIKIHNLNASKDFVKQKALDLLNDVGLGNAESILSLYPHQLSDGVNQRIMIALAIASSPRLLIADEATTNLDMTIQSQILELLSNLSKQRNIAVLTITHDFSILAENTDNISVMYCGYIVESGPTAKLLNDPKHPYTRSLINSVPQLGNQAMTHSHLYTLPGSIPAAHQIPVGCPLGPRCPSAGKPCVNVPPSQISGEQYYRCHFPLNMHPQNSGEKI